MQYKQKMLKNFKNKINGDLHLKELLKGSGISFAFKILGMGFGYIFTTFIIYSIFPLLFILLRRLVYC